MNNDYNANNKYQNECVIDAINTHINYSAIQKTEHYEYLFCYLIFEQKEGTPPEVYFLMVPITEI